MHEGSWRSNMKRGWFRLLYESLDRSRMVWIRIANRSLSSNTGPEMLWKRPRIRTGRLLSPNTSTSFRQSVHKLLREALHSILSRNRRDYSSQRSRYNRGPNRMAWLDVWQLDVFACGSSHQVQRQHYDGLVLDERIELLTNRCFVCSTKPDQDLFLHDDRYTEPL